MLVLPSHRESKDSRDRFGVEIRSEEDGPGRRHHRSGQANSRPRASLAVLRAHPNFTSAEERKLTVLKDTACKPLEEALPSLQMPRLASNTTNLQAQNYKSLTYENSIWDTMGGLRVSV